MKITSLDIKGFGRFKQLKITPGPGFNVIYAENEAGKSTLQAFIRAMFYGLKGGRSSRDGSLPPIRQYRPWNADQYAGVLEYTRSNGDFYRVGRNFDKGTGNIYDMGANNVTASFSHDKETGPKFAEEHLGIDEAAFERSAFIHQSQCAFDSEGRKCLIEKLSNLSTTGSEELSLTRAVGVLDAELLERVGTGRSTTRPLDKVNIRLEELEQKKQRLLELNENYLDTARMLHEKRNQLKELTLSLERLKRQQTDLRNTRLLELGRELEALIQESIRIGDEISEGSREIEKLKRFEDVSEDTLSRAAMLLHDSGRVKESAGTEAVRLSNLQKSIEALKESLEPEEIFQKRMRTVENALENYRLSKEATDRNKSALPRPAASKSSWFRTIVFVFAAVAFMLMGYYISNPAPVFLGAGILVVAVLGAVWSYLGIRKNQQRSHRRTDADDMNEALSESGFKGMTDFIHYRESQMKGRNSLENLNKEMKESKNRYHLFQQQLEDQRKELEELLKGNEEAADSPDTDAQYRQQDPASSLESLKQGVDQLRQYREKVQSLASKKAALDDKLQVVLREAGMMTGRTFRSYDEWKEAMSGLAAPENPGDPDSVSNPGQPSGEISLTEQRIHETKLEITALETRLENAPSEGELTGVMEEMTMLQAKKAEYELAGSGLTLAKQILADAALKLQQDYVPALNEEMSRMMSFLTSGRYPALRTNDKLQVTLEAPETDELIPVSRLSGGTIDQVYFCMRLAAVFLLEREGESLPLFLDEPFSQYDETRSLKAFELLREISVQHQIFFFTCRKREFELAQSVFQENMTILPLQ